LLCSCLGWGCEDGHDHYYTYGPGPGYGPGHFSGGAIRFEWSLAGTTGDGGATSDEDAGAEQASSDAGSASDAGANAGSVSKSACNAIGATQFEALLYDQGTIVAAFQARCSAGSETFRVGSNDYTATAALASDDGVPVTETKVIPTFIVAPGEIQVIRVAFK
jgi:hypothetical protein